MIAFNPKEAMKVRCFWIIFLCLVVVTFVDFCRNIPSEQRVQLVELMWQLWSYVPFSGHKAAQFVDLLGYFTVKSPEVKDKVFSAFYHLLF